MSNRTYNGQLYQSATSAVTFSTLDGLFSFRFQTWEDLKLKLGAESKLANNTDGSIAGYTTEFAKSSAGMKCRLDEWQQFNDQLALAYPGLGTDVAGFGVLQVVFTVNVSYGNAINVLRKDVATCKFQETNRDLPRSQDPLMVDLPMLCLDLTENGRKPLVYPV